MEGENRLGMKYSSWRQQTVKCPAGKVTEVYFGNTNPNMFFVSNFSGVLIYGGLNRVPTFESHEFEFKPYKQKPFGLPLGRRVLYLLNASDTDIQIDVYSTEMPFDLNILHDFSIDKVEITNESPMNIELDSVKEGLTLPVKIDSAKPGTVFSVQTAKEEEIKNQLDIMMKPTEVTGKKNLFSLNQSLSLIANKIKCIPIESYYLSPVGTSCIIKPVTKNVRVGFISNDNNEKSLVVKHTKTTGYIQSTTLKPSEVLNDVWFLDVANIELKFADNTAFNDDVRYSLECY